MFLPSLALVMLMQLGLPPVELTGSATSVPLGAKQVRALSSLAASTTRAVLLQLDDVVAERPPGTYWEVYVAPPGARLDSGGPYYVGNVALFGSGIRSEAGAGFKPAHFVFPLNAALRAAHRAGGAHLVVTFVPLHGAQPRAPVRVGRIGIAEEQKPR
jgi:hypothetical protein